MHPQPRPLKSGRELPNSSRRDTIHAFAGLLVFLILGSIAAWILNLVKLTDCDFRADYKCEVVHAIGLVPVAAPITVWFGTDNDKETP